MTDTENDTNADPGPTPPVAAGLARMRRSAPGATARWLLVDVNGQRLHLMTGDHSLRSWPVSTAAAGLDARVDSGGTPPGLHRIGNRIGQGAQPGTVFVSREPTGRIWPDGVNDGGDLILTRILTLDGVEDGINRGEGVDSAARYIYIHGTNDEAQLGRPCSHGCIRLGNNDIVTLFEFVREGDPVVIL